MTMVNTALTSTPNRGVSLRKTNKPLMEKRRRARINDSLSQLKSLVIHSSKKDSSQFSKLEKADILELTVKHLRGLQAQQQQQQQLQQHHHHMSVQQPTPTGPADTGKYRAGFVECANEVIRYMDQSQGLNNETKTKVVSHLAGCLQLVSNANANNINNNHVHPHNQSKIAPQPIAAQAQQQQQQAPPANAAAILAAAAAAAGNSTTTTTQLPNGQIIQIVSNPLQNAQPAQQGQQAVLGVNPSAPVMSSQNAQQIPAASNKPVPAQQQQSTPNNPAYIHYAQPLHIQIPPIVSPVLIQKESHHHHQQHQQPQPKHIELRESRNSFSSSSLSTSSSSSSLPDQVNDIVSTSSLAPSPPQPQQPRVSNTPPSSLYPGHPKARAQKQLNFFSQQELNKSSSVANSRIVKNTLTPPSSSGSSSESENTSPLNLSQSPPYSAYHQQHHHQHHKSEQHRRFIFPSTDSHNKITEHQKQSIYVKPSSLLGENLAFKDANNNISYAPNATSVIVNSRKCADFTDGKYWSMMEEERHCTRHQNTPSPASSVGEERLWRPW